jgi:predicted O-methyltransferase YrrM
VGRRTWPRRLLEPLLRRARDLTVVRALARSGEYQRLRRLFIDNGRTSKVGVTARADLVRRFEEIDAQVPIASSPLEGLALAEIMIALSPAGAVVECGCYSGGSTAKLSLVAAATRRTLHVFDSFEGLPEVDDWNRRDLHARHGRAWVTDWTAGRYASPVERVRDHVRRFGALEVCHFTKGWFADTLNGANLPDRIAMAFTDVDIPSSARECLVALWPRLEPGGVFASHDIAYIKVMQTFYDRALWTEVLKDFPPVFFGAGFGLGDLAPHVGYAVKGDVSPEYIKTLSLEK